MVSRVAEGSVKRADCEDWLSVAWASEMIVAHGSDGCWCTRGSVLSLSFLKDRIDYRKFVVASC